MNLKKTDLGRIIDLTDADQVRALIEGTETGIYGSENEKGETLAVYVSQGLEMNVSVFQLNGRVRVDYYGPEGTKESETYDGRWK